MGLIYTAGGTRGRLLRSGSLALGVAIYPEYKEAKMLLCCRGKESRNAKFILLAIRGGGDARCEGLQISIRISIMIRIAI